MPFLLALTSHVAASRVGGDVTRAALHARGVDVALIPTVLFGRHPGWGAPGGGAVPDALFAGQIAGVAAHGMFALTDAVLTGYFASAAQVRIAAETIDAVRAASPRERGGRTAFSDRPFIVVDPIMGDAPHGLYVGEDVAAALAEHLIPRADLVAPNAWELARLTGLPVSSPDEALAAARALGRPVLVSSIPCGDEIGVLYANEHDAWLVSHPRRERVPNGTGDLLTAAFIAETLHGATPRDALETAVSAVAHTVEKALTWKAFELPDVTARLTGPPPRLKARPAGAPTGALTPKWVLGLDGCPAGWVGVLMDIEGGNAPQLRIFANFEEALTLSEKPCIIAVDMPIGLVETAERGGRACEAAARKAIRGRATSVFSSPCRSVLTAQSYAEARRLNEAGAGVSLSAQAFALMRKISEIDRVMTPRLENRIHETHPEVAFAVLAGEPMSNNKKKAEGRAERLAVLADQGFPVTLIDPHPKLPGKAARDDVVDAAVCALVAARIARGEAICLPETPPRDARGLRMAIFA